MTVTAGSADGGPCFFGGAGGGWVTAGGTYSVTLVPGGGFVAVSGGGGGGGYAVTRSGPLSVTVGGGSCWGEVQPTGDGWYVRPTLERS